MHLNHNWVLAGGNVNGFLIPFAVFANRVAARTGGPQQPCQNGVVMGYDGSTPQRAEQRKFQFRHDFSWIVTGMGGLGLDFKAGVNFIHEPRLFVTFSSGSTDYAYS